MQRRRSKQNVRYWNQRREKLYKQVPASRLVKNRYKAIRALLKQKYPLIADNEDISAVMVENLLKDAIYLDRQIRLDTEGEEELEKKILSQDYQLNELI